MADGVIMPFWVYMLRCVDGSYYVGHTDDIDVRLAQHQSGALGGYTSDRRPVTLVFMEEMPSRDDAFQRERQIKGWSRVKKEALIKRDWEQLHQIVHAEWRSEGLPDRTGRPSTALGMSGDDFLEMESTGRPSTALGMSGDKTPDAGPTARPSTALGMSGSEANERSSIGRPSTALGMSGKKVRSG